MTAAADPVAGWQPELPATVLPMAAGGATTGRPAPGRTAASRSAVGALATAPHPEPYDAADASVASLPALGTTADLALAPGADQALALAMLQEELHDIDRACSRFRPDGEVLRLADAGGRPVPVSVTLFTAVAVALAMAERTGGAVDPTVGAAVAAWGYDRDFADVADDDATPPTAGARVPGWLRVVLDPRAGTVQVPAGTLLDLGSSAKALAADRAATRIAAALGRGVLVSLGGDVRVAGPPPRGGWPVGIAPDSGTAAGLSQVVAVTAGGLATSSPLTRSWRRAGRTAHHIVDPATGVPVTPAWSLVSATGADCVTANAATTAAVVWGPDAPGRLQRLGQPARLVAMDGTVITLNGWPDDPPHATGATGAGAAAAPTAGAAGAGAAAAPTGDRCGPDSPAGAR